MANAADRNRPDNKNLSPSRAPDGISKDAALIPAVDTVADRRSDIVGEFSDPLPTAPTARTSRRGFLMNTMVSAAYLTTAAAVSTPPIESDPIFAAIAAHQQAADFHSKCVRHQFALEEVLPRDKCRSTPCGSKVVETDDPRWIEAVQATNDTCDTMYERAIALIDTPTTAAGVAALLKYVSDHGGDDDWMFPEFVSCEDDEDNEDDEEFGESYRLAVIRYAAEALDRITTPHLV